MTTICRSTLTVVDRWPVWFQLCFLEADSFSRRTGRWAFSRAAYDQGGHGDLIVAWRRGTDPTAWTDRPNAIIGTEEPGHERGLPPPGAEWGDDGTGQTACFYLSHFVRQRWMLFKTGEAGRRFWARGMTNSTELDESFRPRVAMWTIRPLSNLKAVSDNLHHRIGNLAPPPR